MDKSKYISNYIVCFLFAAEFLLTIQFPLHNRQHNIGKQKLSSDVNYPPLLDNTRFETKPYASTLHVNTLLFCQDVCTYRVCPSVKWRKHNITCTVIYACGRYAERKINKTASVAKMLKFLHTVDQLYEIYHHIRPKDHPEGFFNADKYITYTHTTAARRQFVYK